MFFQRANLPVILTRMLCLAESAYIHFWWKENEFNNNQENDGNQE